MPYTDFFIIGNGFDWHQGLIKYLFMNKDVINLIKDSAATILNIAQMTQYRMKTH